MVTRSGTWLTLAVLLMMAVYQAISMETSRRQRRRRERSQAVHLPPSLQEKIASNPLKDQPNLSSKTPDYDDVIHGARKAVTVTRKNYLKKNWCKTENMKQVIRVEGCLRSTIMNRFCYGQCNSFFIPKSDKKDKTGNSAFQSCGFCKPKRYSWITVTLRCPGQKTKYKKRKIRRIKQCKCMAQKLD